MRSHFILVRITTVKKTRNNTCWRECVEKGALLCCCGKADWRTHYGEHYGGSPKTKNRNTT